MTISVILSTFLCLTSISTGTCLPGLVGQVDVISSNESVELYLVTDSNARSIFSARLDLHLRLPCPACHPSYNYIWHEDQLVLPSTGIVTFFTFLSVEPYVYTQVVALPDCDPLSMFQSAYVPNALYLDCLDLRTGGGNYFLAMLERFQNEKDEMFWIFRRLSGFEGLEKAGAYVEVSAFTSVYVHEVETRLEFNGFLTGYYSSLEMPENCARVVRITATSDEEDLLLLECSTNDSKLISNIFLVSGAGSEHLLSTSPYSLCPIRLLNDGELVVVFTNEYILLIDLLSESFVNFTISHAVYDGVVTQSTEDEVYLVYSTAAGLFRAHLSLHRNPMDINLQSVSVFPDTSTVCVGEGCPLITLADEDVILVSLENKISTFSVSSLQKVAPDIESNLIPSRIVFQRVNASLFPAKPTTTASSAYCSDTSSRLQPSLHYHLTSSAGGNREKSSHVVYVIVSVTLTFFMTFMTIVVITLVFARRLRQRKQLSSIKTWYSRSSDTVELISLDSESVASGESSNNSASLIISSGTCYEVNKNNVLDTTTHSTLTTKKDNSNKDGHTIINNVTKREVDSLNQDDDDNNDKQNPSNTQYRLNNRSSRVEREMQEEKCGRQQILIVQGPQIFFP